MKTQAQSGEDSEIWGAMISLQNRGWTLLNNVEARVGFSEFAKRQV